MFYMLPCIAKLIRAGSMLVLILSFMQLPTGTSVHADFVPSVQRFGIVEETFLFEKADIGNPWHDVVLEVSLIAPDGTSKQVQGFHYAPGEWRWRYAPEKVGMWRWGAVMWPRNDRTGGPLAQRSGLFDVVASSEPGFLRVSSSEVSGLVFDSGRPFRALGMSECINDYDNSGTPHDNNWNIDVESGNPPPGGEGSISLQEFTSLYGRDGARFNLFRWGDDNCSFSIYKNITTTESGNIYYYDRGKWVDEMFAAFKAQGFRIFMSVFGFYPPYSGSTTDVEYRAIGRYLDYVVARYGAYVDIWELANEAAPGNDWVIAVGGMLKARDPYAHPVSMSWERPDLGVIDIAAPHWYESEDELVTDRRTSEMISQFRDFKKPIIFAEQGNRGGNWDPLSARRMRIRSWTALFEGGGLVFWDTSFKKTYRAVLGNIYLGPQERAYVRALQDYASTLPTALGRFRPNLLTDEDGPQVRGYGLFTASGNAIYLVHVGDRTRNITQKIEVAVPFSGMARWRDPSTGNVVKEQPVTAGRATLQSPPFQVDLLLDIRSTGSGVDVEPSRQIQVANVLLRIGPPSTQSAPGAVPIVPTPLPAPFASPTAAPHLRKD